MVIYPLDFAQLIDDTIGEDDWLSIGLIGVTTGVRNLDTELGMGKIHCLLHYGKELCVACYLLPQ